MYFSKYNIFSRIKDSDNYFLINILSGNADIVSAQKAEEIKQGIFTDREEFIEKGYLTDEQEEKKLYVEEYLNFTERREKDEVQLFFVPWYVCNFNCTYCYQSGYENEFVELSISIIDAFFKYIEKEFSGRHKYVTIFGGEPLLNGTKYENLIRYFLHKAAEAGLDTAIVTNGYYLEEYIEIFKEHKIREIQVTLDGVGITHDSRRPLKGGKATFEKIVSGIDAALTNNLNINLRAVIDKENISGLADLARWAIAKGWTKHQNFKTQLGRNYELHYCQSGRNKLFSRVEFYESLFNLIGENPEIMEFHRPAFSISKFLFDNGELPQPLFDACTGCKTEWAFDYTGQVYSCTATVGKPGAALGTFFPEITRKDDIIKG
ncbi:MAG: radical SAM protein, partial [Methanococcaceae archaeon]